MAVALSWFGLERLEVRFVRATRRCPRTHRGVERVAGAHERLALGHRLRLQHLRRGAVPGAGLASFPGEPPPGPSPVREALESGERYGYRAPGDLPGLAWYREAHNDWVQLLVETGLPGLAIGLWAAIAVLLAARGDPWLFAALAGPLIHAFVDFDFQIPAIPVLFVVLATLAGSVARGLRTLEDGPRSSVGLDDSQQFRPDVLRDVFGDRARMKGAACSPIEALDLVGKDHARRRQAVGQRHLERVALPTGGDRAPEHQADPPVRATSAGRPRCS